MTGMQRSLTLLASLLGGSLLAQTVHVVGPGGFAQVQQAINAASNGDVIVIQSGAYHTFTLGKDLTLTATPGAVVDIFQPASSIAGTVLQPPTLAKIAGIRFRFAGSAPLGSALVVNGGTVHFADCGFDSYWASIMAPPAMLVQNAAVAMQRCTVIGGGTMAIGPGSSSGNDGLRAIHAKVAAVDCLFFGGNLFWDFIGHGGHGVVVDDSDVQLANCFCAGGDNHFFNPAWPPGDGVHVATTSRVWLADCELHGGNGHGNPGGGGHGLANLGSIAAQEARSSFFGGAGAPAGAPVVGPLVTAPLLGLDGVTPPIAIGTTWSVGYRTAPGTPVLALFGDTLSWSTLPPLAEPAWLPANAFAVAGLGVTDPNGVLAFTFAVPATPSLLHAPCFVQAFAGVALPLEAAPPVGGVVR